MGNKASRPARKLTKHIVHADNTAAAPLRIHLPTQAMKDRFEHPEQAKTAKTEPQPKPETTGNGSEVTGPSTGAANTLQTPGGPEGKDGADPQADQNYINFINNLGRQIHSQTASSPGQEHSVTALKQLLNRKKLYEKGQNEIEAQLGSTGETRSMLHPRTLTAVINALADKRTDQDAVCEDYQVDRAFLANLGRFRVADRIVVIEETTKEDEIGPKVGQAAARAATEPSMIDYNGDMAEEVNSDRLRELQRRLQ